MCLKPSRVPTAPVEPLAKHDKWLEDFDFEGFAAEIRALGKRLEAGQGEKDVNHLNKMILWSNTFATIGFLTAGLAVNPVTIFCISMFIFTRWACIAHHTCHGGYQNCHPNLSRWSRFKFGLGSVWRRYNDFFDWMLPEAWNVEHNTRHHYNLSELTDPDLVENNSKDLRSMEVPIYMKYPLVIFFMCTWKWFYYSSNTYKELKLAKLRKEGRKVPDGVVAEDQITVRAILLGENPFYSAAEFMTKVAGPYLLMHFFVAPLPWYFVGRNLDGFTGLQMFTTALTNLVLADVLSNMHGFLCVVTNHAGDDMYRFRNACRPYSGSFFLRQVLASANYSMGTDAIDFFHAYLNYQVEHHLWPNLSMKSYQIAAPQVQEICKRYGVPYTKENCFIRLKKTVDIMVGKADMRWFPEKYEELFLEMDAELEKQKSK